MHPKQSLRFTGSRSQWRPLLAFRSARSGVQHVRICPSEETALKQQLIRLFGHHGENYWKLDP